MQSSFITARYAPGGAHSTKVIGPFTQTAPLLRGYLERASQLHELLSLEWHTYQCDAHCDLAHPRLRCAEPQ